MSYIEAFIGPWKNIKEKWMPYICHKSKLTTEPGMVWTQWYGYPNEKDWTEESRYERHTQKIAEDIYNAIFNRRHGVLRWLKRHW